MSATVDTVVLSREPTGRQRTSVKRPRPAPSDVVRGRAPRRASLGAFTLIMLACLSVGLVGMLLVNTQLAQGAFAISELQRQQADLVEREQQLAEQVAYASAPLRLEEMARSLGMVPQEMPTFLRLSDGAILGNAIPQPLPIEPTLPDPSELVVDPDTGQVVRADTGEVVPEAWVDEYTGEIVVEDPGLVVVEP